MNDELTPAQRANAAGLILPGQARPLDVPAAPAPAGGRSKPISVLEHGTGAGILIKVPDTGACRIEDADQIVMPSAGAWVVVEAEAWAELAQKVARLSAIEKTAEGKRAARKDRIKASKLTVVPGADGPVN